MEKEHGGYPARLVSLDQMALWIGSLRKEQQNHFMQQKQPLIRNLIDFLIFSLEKAKRRPYRAALHLRKNILKNKKNKLPKMQAKHISKPQFSKRIPVHVQRIPGGHHMFELESFHHPPQREYAMVALSSKHDWQNH